MSCYFDIDMILFIGFIQVGVEVSKVVVDMVKCVVFEFGGKLVNIILDDVDMIKVVINGIKVVFVNFG